MIENIRDFLTAAGTCYCGYWGITHGFIWLGIPLLLLDGAFIMCLVMGYLMEHLDAFDLPNDEDDDV